jgi:hypothetical protein
MKGLSCSSTGLGAGRGTAASEFTVAFIEQVFVTVDAYDFICWQFVFPVTEMNFPKL